MLVKLKFTVPVNPATSFYKEGVATFQSCNSNKVSFKCEPVPVKMKKLTVFSLMVSMTKINEVIINEVIIYLC